LSYAPTGGICWQDEIKIIASHIILDRFQLSFRCRVLMES